MKYFLDPLKVIKHFKGCKFNPQHSKLDSLELGMVWKHMNGGDINLNGAHDSLVDAKAQSDIIIHPSFVPYLNKSASIDEVGLSLRIDEAIVCSIQIDAPSFHVLPYHPKLKNIQLGMLWVELAALEMFDDLQGIQEVLHLGWQQVW